MIFHENRLLADDSPYFFRKLGKMLQNLSSSAVVIGALWVNPCHAETRYILFGKQCSSNQHASMELASQDIQCYLICVKPDT